MFTSILKKLTYLSVLSSAVFLFGMTTSALGFGALIAGLFFGVSSAWPWLFIILSADLVLTLIFRYLRFIQFKWIEQAVKQAKTEIEGTLS